VCCQLGYAGSLWKGIGRFKKMPQKNNISFTMITSGKLSTNFSLKVLV
jgi:hypothetical protein